MKRLMKLFFALVVFFNAGVSYAQNTVLQISDEEVKNILLNGTPEDLKNLLNKKIDVNIDYNCSTLLNLAIRSLVANQSPTATSEDALEKVNMLIKAGADVNLNTCGLTPLATLVGLPHMARQMVNVYVNTIMANMDYSTDICHVNGRAKVCKDTTTAERAQMKAEIIQIFKEEIQKNEPYYTQIADILLQHGADINKKSNGIAPLHFAANVPHGENPIFLKYLLAKGADVNIRDFQGSTPLFVANFADNKEVIDLLIQSGADENIRNNKGVLYKDFKTGEYYNFD